jgi:hypothetical protein
MALEMRPNCEKCNVRLPHIAMAYICSHECTFCSNCSTHMHFTCPNCGGELARRPRREPKQAAAEAGPPEGQQVS